MEKIILIQLVKEKITKPIKLKVLWLIMKNGILVVHVMINKKLKSKSKIYLAQLLINHWIRSDQKKARILKRLVQMLIVEIKDLHRFKMLQSKYFNKTLKYKLEQKRRKKKKKRKIMIKILGKMKNLKVGRKMNKLCKFKQ